MNSVYSFNKYYFLSPHLDDAILSCGALISKLRTMKKNVTVITVFTKVTGRPYSKVAQELLDKCGFDDAEKLFEEREKEDIRVMKRLGCKFIHLDFIDAAWRKRKIYEKYSYLRPLIKHTLQLVHIYADGKKQFSGRPSSQDLWLIDDIKIKLDKFLPNDNKTLIFAPLGVGRHADHVLVRDAAKTLNKKVFFWEDFPYNTKNQSVSSKIQGYKFLFEENGNAENKIKHIKTYSSQIPALFPSGVIPLKSEKYYIEAK